MTPDSLLADTASMFLALGDRTRLRLLNLMRGREVCVSSFTEILGQSQPLISRHLAYLRSSGLVETRRDGKWMHYRISTSLDENSDQLLKGLFKWMEGQNALLEERGRYESDHAIHEHDMLEAVPIPKKRAVRRKAALIDPEPARQDDEPYLDIQSYIEPEPEIDFDYPDPTPVRHNELEDFLL